MANQKRQASTMAPTCVRVGGGKAWHVGHLWDSLATEVAQEPSTAQTCKEFIAAIALQYNSEARYEDCYVQEYEICVQIGTTLKDYIDVFSDPSKRWTLAAERPALPNARPASMNSTDMRVLIPALRHVLQTVVPRFSARRLWEPTPEGSPERAPKRRAIIQDEDEVEPPKFDPLFIMNIRVGANGKCEYLVSGTFGGRSEDRWMPAESFTPKQLVAIKEKMEPSATIFAKGKKHDIRNVLKNTLAKWILNLFDAPNIALISATFADASHNIPKPLVRDVVYPLAISSVRWSLFSTTQYVDFCELAEALNRTCRALVATARHALPDAQNSAECNVYLYVNEGDEPTALDSRMANFVQMLPALKQPRVLVAFEARDFDEPPAHIGEHGGYRQMRNGFALVNHYTSADKDEPEIPHSWFVFVLERCDANPLAKHELALPRRLHPWWKQTVDDHKPLQRRDLKVVQWKDIHEKTTE